MFTLTAAIFAVAQHQPETSITPKEALRLMTEGNARYVSGRMSHANQGADRREEVAKGQHPHTIVLTCADSRLSPEIVFDQGLGDLFVVRVAGNVVDTNGLASIEYAHEHLGANLLVILGHERCGAVQAAVDTFNAPQPKPAAEHGKHAEPDKHENEHANLEHLIGAILPAVKANAGKAPNLLDAAIATNVKNTLASTVEHSPLLRKAVFAGSFQIVGGVYDLDTGKADLWAPYQPKGGYVRVVGHQ